VRHGDTCTRNEAEAWLLHDLHHFMDCVNKHVKVDLTDHQKAALFSFVYNLGCGAFRKSTLLKKLNAGDKAGAAREFLKWDHAGGRRLAGLTRRRESESEEFLA
jgi:lysozyme